MQQVQSHKSLNLEQAIPRRTMGPPGDAHPTA